MVFHLFFNTFANWTIFVGVVRRSNGRSLKNSKLKKNACHCSAELFFQSTPRKIVTFFFIFSSCVSLFHLFNAFTSPQEGPGGGARGAPRPDDFISQKHAPCLSRKQNPETCLSNEREAPYMCKRVYVSVYKCIPLRSNELGLASPPRLGASPLSI